jgi:hypothetical protein
VLYISGVGVTMVALAHGSQAPHGALHGEQGTAHAGWQGTAHAGVQGCVRAPRNSPGQHPHPAVVVISVNTAAKIISFLITGTSLRNGLVPSFGSSNSARELYTTPGDVQPPRRLFFATAGSPFCNAACRIRCYISAENVDRARFTKWELRPWLGRAGNGVRKGFSRKGAKSQSRKETAMKVLRRCAAA